MTQINSKHLSHLFNESLRGIEFYKQELGFLQERLDEIASDNTGKEVAEKVEHFQNQFIIHKNELDELSHQIKESNMRIGLELPGSASFVNLEQANEHNELNEKFLMEEKMFNEMRHDFNRFAAQWM